MGDKFKIILAPSLELAQKIDRPVATVEAEYGDTCIEGSIVTLAHHGSRSQNPAPCNTPDVPALDGGTILISHIDLDALGGIFAIMGMKEKDDEFWKGAELVDVKGVHHIHELSQNVQDKLNAFYAYVNERKRVRYTEIIDVTEIVEEYRQALIPILREQDIRHEEVIEQGRIWNQQALEKVEARLVSEDQYIRCFITDGVFCSASYFSPKMKTVIPATVSMNTLYHAITVAFADGGKKYSARQIVIDLWGDAAGGRDGIGGSPRNWDIDEETLKNEFERCCHAVRNIVAGE